MLRTVPEHCCSVKMARMKNLVVLSAVVGGIGLALYPIVFSPMMNSGASYGKRMPFTYHCRVTCNLAANAQKEFLEAQGLQKKDIQPAGTSHVLS